MCRWYTRFYHNYNTLIIQKRTAYISNDINLLIQDVADINLDKVIFITNVEGTTPDAVCCIIHPLGNDLTYYMYEPIRTIKNLMLNNLNSKFVFIQEEYNNARTWTICNDETDGESDDEKNERKLFNIDYYNYNYDTQSESDDESNRDDEFDDDARLFNFFYYENNYNTQSESDDGLDEKDLNGSVLD